MNTLKINMIVISFMVVDEEEVKTGIYRDYTL